MKILVTGAAGFLGSHLVNRLIDRGNSVIGLDNLSTGRSENLRHLTNNSKFEFINADINNPIQVEVDYTFNLACPASPKHYQSDPIQTMTTCVTGVINLLNLARKLGVPIFQASTSEVYGDPQVHPQVEEYFGNVNPIGPRSCYDEGKRAAETLFFDYRRTYSTPIHIARIFNTYGPRMLIDDGRVVSNFIVQALRGENLTIYGDGRQTRSFCYVDDLIDGFIMMMDLNDKSIGPINLGNPCEFTVVELAELIISKVDSSSKLIFEPLPQDDPRQRKPNIDKACDSLNWLPKTNLSEGLDKTIHYFQRLLTSK